MRNSCWVHDFREPSLIKTTGFEVCDEEAVNPFNRQRERRREERVTGSRLCARVRPGYRLVVIDLSVRGALVEAGRPLRPDRGWTCTSNAMPGAKWWRRGSFAARLPQSIPKAA
jgi:hypothetical protein